MSGARGPDLGDMQGGVAPLHHAGMQAAQDNMQ
jgi:hypothetical protein